MFRSRLILASLAVMLSATSCGIFKKDCGCPHFGKVKTQPKPHEAPVVYAAR